MADQANTRPGFFYTANPYGVASQEYYFDEFDGFDGNFLFQQYTPTMFNSQQSPYTAQMVSQPDADTFTIGAVPDVFAGCQPSPAGEIEEAHNHLHPEVDEIAESSYQGTPGLPITIGGSTTETCSYVATQDKVYRFPNSFTSGAAYRTMVATNLAEDERIQNEVFKIIPERDQIMAVNRIYSGFVNLVNIIDKPSSRLRQAAQAVKSFLQHEYCEAKLEELSWEAYTKLGIVQYKAKNNHPSLTQKVETYETLDKRVDAFICSIKQSKAMVKQLLDPIYLTRLVANPVGETKMKHSNKKINSQRDEENALGRSAKKAGLDKQQLEATINNNGNDSTPAPKSRASRKQATKRKQPQTSATLDHHEDDEETFTPTKKRNTGSHKKAPTTPNANPTTPVTHSMRARLNHPVYTDASPGFSSDDNGTHAQLPPVNNFFDSNGIFY